MKEITQFNIRTHEDEVVSGIDPDIGICFVTSLGRYEVKINDQGGIDILTIGKVSAYQSLVVSPHSGNKVSVSILGIK